MYVKESKNIVIDDERNYIHLKKLGKAGESPNDVITQFLAKLEAREARRMHPDNDE